MNTYDYNQDNRYSPLAGAEAAMLRGCSIPNGLVERNKRSSQTEVSLLSYTYAIRAFRHSVLQVKTQIRKENIKCSILYLAVIKCKCIIHELVLLHYN